jgi:SAM-dependent methyltransferase
VPGAEPALVSIEYLLRRCATCGSAVTVGTAPTTLHESGAYRPGDPRLYRFSQPLLRAFDAERLALLRSLVAPGARILDAGAGRGRFLAAARAAGYDASGIEPSQRGSAAASRLGLPVQPATIEEATIGDSTLDAVTLWHVLEHLDQPGAALDRVSRWLRPHGGLLVAVPNLASLQARLGGTRWYHLDVPRHRVHFTPSGLGQLLRSRGFAVLGTRHLLLEHNAFGMWQSLVNRLTSNPSYLYNLLKRNAPLCSPDLAITALALPMAPLAAIAELLAGLTGRGGTITVLARRTG